MKPLPGWQAALKQAHDAPQSRRMLAPRVDPVRAAGRMWSVTTAAEGDALLHMLRSSPIGAIAIDSEFSFTRPLVKLRSGKEWSDVRSQRPICVSLAAWLTADPEKDNVVRAVLDVRNRAVVPILVEVLRLHAPLIFHHIKAELFTFWALGLDPQLYSIYDTYLAAACIHLGRYHKRGQKAVADEAEQIRAEDALLDKRTHLLSLVGQCAHYGLGYPHSISKDSLRCQFLDVVDEPLNDRQIEYAADDAEWTLRLYLAQQADVLRSGLHHHLHTVEFPFAIPNARIEWNGVHCSRDDLRKLRDATSRAATHNEKILADHSIIPAGSRNQFLVLMRSLGLEKHFILNGKLRVTDKLLEKVENLHPAIEAFRLQRKYRRLAHEEWLTGVMIGVDGRIHPQHNQLGAATGRNSCSTPNLAGIGQVLRPVVTAPAGRALVDLDYGQIEVGVAAAEHNDPDLIKAYNSGDVYAAMAQRFYRNELPEEAREMSASEFKLRYPGKRDRMKTFVLSVIYNIQAKAIATRFGMSEKHAEEERRRFLDMFPCLQQRQEESSVYGAVRGYAEIVSGLRRKTTHTGRPDSWTNNFLRNTPIQGSATVVFKRAVIDLHNAFRGTPTLLVLPVHDSILIECNVEDVDAVAQQAHSIMVHAVRAYYPQLKPRVDINRSDTRCWNKDGHGDSLEQFLSDPSIRIEEMTSHALPTHAVLGMVPAPFYDLPVLRRFAARLPEELYV